MLQKPTLIKPELSVVVIAICGSTYVHRCLNALKRQVDAPKFEVVVVYDENLEDIPPMFSRFPNVRVYRKHDGTTPEELASVGIKNARSDIIALTEDHCIPDAHWCRRMLDAHSTPHAAIGGAVECVSNEPLSWAFSFCDYYRYMNPVPNGPTKYLTVCNVSYKRRALDKVAKVWGNNFHEVAVNNTLQERGETLWLTPQLIVLQERTIRLGPAIRERFSFGRLFGSRRAVDSDVRFRFVYNVLAPLVPLLLLTRMFVTILSKKRPLRIFLQALPMLAVFTFAWSWGEFLGNFLGRVPKQVYVGRS